MSTASADRAQQALHFLRNELPHWEDMLKYLDNDESNAACHAFRSDEIDINVINYKIKLSRYLNKNESNGRSELWIYNSIDSDPLENQINQFTKEESNKLEMNSYLSKPDFKKISQVNWLEMAEIEEQDSSFSSITDNQSNWRNIRNEISDALNKTTINKTFVVKSPAYCKRSAAELKVKESILTWYTTSSF